MTIYNPVHFLVASMLHCTTCNIYICVSERQCWPDELAHPPRMHLSGQLSGLVLYFGVLQSTLLGVFRVYSCPISVCGASCKHDRAYACGKWKCSAMKPRLLPQGLPRSNHPGFFRLYAPSTWLHPLEADKPSTLGSGHMFYDNVSHVLQQGRHGDMADSPCPTCFAMISHMFWHDVPHGLQWCQT